MSPPSFIFGFLVLAVAAGAWAQSPEINRIQPVSARPGETVTVTLQGKDLLQPMALWTSFGAATLWETESAAHPNPNAKPDGKKLTARLTLPKEAPLGVGFLRLPTATGLSGALLFLVDDLPLSLKKGGSSVLSKAQSVTLPAAIEGATDTGYSDYFKIQPRTGEGISAEVYGIRLGSKIDPLLRLLDAQGRELVRSDDTPGLAGDCHLRYVPNNSEPLFLEVRDITHAGGPDYFYHLRVGDFPLASTVFPPVAPPETTAEVELSSADGTVLPPQTISVPSKRAAVVSVPFRHAPDKPAAFASLRVEDVPVILKTNASPTADAVQEIAAPAILCGRLSKSAARDTVQITLNKDEQLRLVPITRELSSPAVLYLGIRDEKGVLLAANDSGAATDQTLNFKAPRNGRFLIVIEDLARRGGAEFVYALRIERSSRSFELSVAADRIVTSRGGTFVVKVTTQRKGVEGPITLALENVDRDSLFPALVCEQTVIPAGKSEAMLTVTAPKDVSPGTVYHLRVSGTASEVGQTYAATSRQVRLDANKKDPMTTVLLAMPAPPRLLLEAFPVCVGPESPDFFKIELATPAVELPQIINKSSFVLRQTAIDPAFDANAQIKFEGLPSGISIQAESGRGGRIKGQVDFICQISVVGELASGTHTFSITASADLKGVHKEVRLANVPLRVVKPLGINVQTEAPLSPGSKRLLKIKATRYDESDPQPVELRFTNLPDGISINRMPKMAPSETEVTVEIEVSDGAREAKYESLQLSATTTVKGVPVVVDALFSLEVRK